MKRMLICMLLVCFPWHAAAQSEIADEQANCNASFQGGCPFDQTFTTSSDGFAAPVGALGSSGLEILLVTMLIAGGIACRLNRPAAEGGRKSSYHRAS